MTTTPIVEINRSTPALYEINNSRFAQLFQFGELFACMYDRGNHASQVWRVELLNDVIGLDDPARALPADHADHLQIGERCSHVLGRKPWKPSPQLNSTHRLDTASAVDADCERDGEVLHDLRRVAALRSVAGVPRFQADHGSSADDIGLRGADDNPLIGTVFLGHTPQQAVALYLAT